MINNLNLNLICLKTFNQIQFENYVEVPYQTRFIPQNVLFCTLY